MTFFAEVVDRGLAAARPAVGDVPIGSIYYSTDTGALERNSGSAWQTIAPTSAPPSGTAGGVLAGSYPNPSFAADMATQAELDAHLADTSAAHAASAIAFTPNGSIAATTVQAAIQEVRDEAGGGGGGGGTKYITSPTGWRDCWDAAVAAQATTPALAAIIGDSFSQGYGSSDWPANGSQNLIAAALAALVGDGGDFYAPSDSLAFQAGYQGTPPFVVNPSATPQFLSQGFARTLFNGATLAGANATFTTPDACTAIDLLLYRFPTAGTFTYTVDGGSPVTVNVTSLTQGQINRVSLTGLANTTHTIVFGDTSALYALGLVGVATYRAATGVYVARCGWGTAKIAHYLAPSLTQLNSEADATTRLGTRYWRAAANTDALFPADPHLAILALGLNDATAGSTREEYRDALSRFIRALRRGRADMSILLVAHNYPDAENADAADPGAGGAYAGYVASLYDAAQAHNCGVVNLFAKWGETSYADGLQGNSDFHPTDAGHQDIADMVMAALTA